MGIFETNAGAFFIAVLVVGAIGGWVGRKLEKWLSSWNENRLRS